MRGSGWALADLFDADDRAAWDLARSLPLARNVHNDHGPVPSRLSANANVDRASILVMNGEHDLRVGLSGPTR